LKFFQLPKLALCQQPRALLGQGLLLERDLLLLMLGLLEFCIVHRPEVASCAPPTSGKHESDNEPRDGKGRGSGHATPEILAPPGLRDTRVFSCCSDKFPDQRRSYLWSHPVESSHRCPLISRDWQ